VRRPRFVRQTTTWWALPGPATVRQAPLTAQGSPHGDLAETRPGRGARVPTRLPRSALATLGPVDLDQPPFSDLLDAIGELTDASGTQVVPIVLIIVVAIVGAWLAGIFVHGIVKALLDREATEGTAQELSAVEVKKRMETLDQLATNVIRFFIVVIAALMILGKLGLDIGPAVAGLGVVGIAVGFGAQTLVRDYLNGSLILIENQFSKGDVVRLAGVAGTVEDFNLRRTTVRDIDGVVHTVPNGEIKVASNLTRVWARINQDVLVAYDTDIDKAIRVVDDVGRTMAGEPEWKRRILEAPRVERVEALGEYGVTLKILGSVRAPEQWAAAGEFRKRLLAALQANGIEIPRPQRVVLSQDPGGALVPELEDIAAGPDQDDLAADTD
jgi:small-conductance mechanosensitive channel